MKWELTIVRKDGLSGLGHSCFALTSIIYWPGPKQSELEHRMKSDENWRGKILTFFCQGEGKDWLAAAAKSELSQVALTSSKPASFIS